MPTPLVSNAPSLTAGNVGALRRGEIPWGLLLLAGLVVYGWKKIA